MSNTKFLITYLIAMTTTYVWRYLFFAIAVASDGADVSTANSIALLISYIIMSYVTYSRGAAVGKKYLVAFPIVAALFDLVLVFVPFVPTIMNIITIVLVLQSTPSQTKPSTN